MKLFKNLEGRETDHQMCREKRLKLTRKRMKLYLSYGSPQTYLNIPSSYIDNADLPNIAQGGTRHMPPSIQEIFADKSG